MTTKKAYECNLCHSTVRDGAGRGFHFGNKRVDWTTIQQAENHLCDNCVQMLMTSFRDSGIREQFDEAAAPTNDFNGQR